MSIFRHARAQTSRTVSQTTLQTFKDPENLKILLIDILKNLNAATFATIFPSESLMSN